MYKGTGNRLLGPESATTHHPSQAQAQHAEQHGCTTAVAHQQWLLQKNRRQQKRQRKCPLVFAQGSTHVSHIAATSELKPAAVLHFGLRSAIKSWALQSPGGSGCARREHASASGLAMREELDAVGESPVCLKRRCCS